METWRFSGCFFFGGQKDEEKDIAKSWRFLHYIYIYIKVGKMSLAGLLVLGRSMIFESQTSYSDFRVPCNTFCRSCGQCDETAGDSSMELAARPTIWCKRSEWDMGKKEVFDGQNASCGSLAASWGWCLFPGGELGCVVVRRSLWSLLVLRKRDVLEILCWFRLFLGPGVWGFNTRFLGSQGLLQRGLEHCGSGASQGMGKKADGSKAQQPRTPYKPTPDIINHFPSLCVMWIWCSKHKHWGP